ncbi:GNAT family N-acetyltransferase [Methanoculleus sp. MH98A]|uniref:GNAT family N-acetyltransferase n=1 Tax=Methanoculleus sp. MH98A TaxID=1495314 RepID=UPI000AC7E269|nr:GNAT family N-acetyltransferase [Methanoculleus sp. MH98A]
MKKEVRELEPGEFPLAEKIWTHYRGQKADPTRERIFAVFVDGVLAATARCTLHSGGLEMDCVFTLDDYRGSGYAKEAVQMLLDKCGSETIYIHSTLPLIGFYGRLGFEPSRSRGCRRASRSGSSSASGRWRGATSLP